MRLWYRDRLQKVVLATELCESYVLENGGVTRFVIPGRAWEDDLQLAVTEVRDYGAGSVQVCRRLRALLEALLAVAPPARRPAVEEELRAWRWSSRRRSATRSAERSQAPRTGKVSVGACHGTPWPTSRRRSRLRIPCDQRLGPATRMVI
jgi:uncharacterized membrane protein